MLFFIIVLTLLCSSSVRAGPSITLTYPNSWTEASCTGNSSLTMWFNSNRPGNNGGFDRELLSNIRPILEIRGHNTCANPQGAQVRPSTQLPANISYSGEWMLTDGAVTGFISTTPNIDFQIQFCCANSNSISTTTTTTTPRPLLSNTCGRASISNSLQLSRIVGGSHAVPHSWPWQVLYGQAIPCNSSKDVCLSYSYCGGTLIDQYHILTAAHCIRTNNPAHVTITAGLHNRSNVESPTKQERSVARIFKHTNYNNITIDNDIAILRLSQPVVFNTYVQPACLPGPEPQPDADVVLIGWGRIQSGGVSSNELKQTKVKVIGDCKKYWSNSLDEEKQVCVGHRVTGDSSCHGDSGGPMLYLYKGQWIVSGISSFISSSGCTTMADSLPNVYVRVSGYLPWIMNVLKS